MKNKKFHINKNSGGEFPEPGIPADEAWKQMHTLLIKNNLTTTPKKDKRRIVLLFLLLFLFAGTAGIIGYKLFLQDHLVKAVASKQTSQIATGDQNKNDDLPADTSRLTMPEDKSDSMLKNRVAETNLTGLTRIENNLRPGIFHDTASIKNTAGEGILNGEINIEPQTGSKEINKNNPKTIISSPPAIQNNPGDSAQKNNDSFKPALPFISSASKNTNNKNAKPGKFYFGLQWNINFSLKNNTGYFEAYNGNKQYYMWLLPSAWAKMDIGKKQGVLVQLNPYSQQFAGKQILNVEKPLIASVEPDIVTTLVKSRGFNLGLKYEYKLSDKIDLAAGLNYTAQQNALYLEQAVEAYSGNVLSEKMYAAKRSEASFQYLKPSYMSWNTSVKYNFGKLGVGAGITKPINNLSSNPDYQVRPLNAEVYLQYRLK